MALTLTPPPATNDPTPSSLLPKANNDKLPAIPDLSDSSGGLSNRTYFNFTVYCQWKASGAAQAGKSCLFTHVQSGWAKLTRILMRANWWLPTQVLARHLPTEAARADFVRKVGRRIAEAVAPDAIEQAKRSREPRAAASGGDEALPTVRGCPATVRIRAGFVPDPMGVAPHGLCSAEHRRL